MNSIYTIRIFPKKPGQDPVAKALKVELIEGGEPPATATVSTERLFKITGGFTLSQIENIAETLLVDPVVERALIEDPKRFPSKKGKKAGGYVLDVWPKAGVTDPVGETVEKGVRDLGFQGNIQAASAYRYIFPKTKNLARITFLAKQNLANELIHDIRIRKIA